MSDDTDIVQRLRELAQEFAKYSPMRKKRDTAAEAADTIEALRADAGRYRWLRSESEMKHDFYSEAESWMVSRQQGGMGQNFFGHKIDAAIDAAMSHPAKTEGASEGSATAPPETPAR